MKLYELKRKIVGWLQYIRGKESKLFSMILVAALIFMLMSTMNDKANKQLKDDNILLRAELLKTQIKLQTTYYIIVRQGETIDHYKSALMECKETNKTWTQEKETK